MVEHASDDELFASADTCVYYLTPATAELESGDDHSVEAAYANVSQSSEKDRRRRTVAARSGVSQSDVGQFVRQGKNNNAGGAGRRRLPPSAID